MTTACARDSEVQAQRGAGVTAVHPRGPRGAQGSARLSVRAAGSGALRARCFVGWEDRPVPGSAATQVLSRERVVLSVLRGRASDGLCPMS